MRKTLKRIIDILGSIFALLIFLPISVFIGVRIKFEDNGPILYKQMRIGRDGNPFYMWKFRSMVVGAHGMKAAIEKLNESDGPTFKIKQDPRVTKIGQFIRKRSLDEIPQFINVLRGEMSMVGPRPALPEEVRSYSDEAKRRLKVKPGITGLWQVSGRSNLPYDMMIKLDLTYVNEATIWMDIKILITTVIQMFDSNNSGAY